MNTANQNGSGVGGRAGLILNYVLAH